MPEYELYCFAQSGNCYRAALMLNLIDADWKPVFPLAVAVVVITAGFLLDHPGDRADVRGVSVKEADQVEQTLDDIQLLHQFDSVATPR